MRIVISSGHGKYVRGASGYIDEVDEARKVVEQVATDMRGDGHEVTTYHDDVSHSQNENLNRIVDFHNSKTRDLDVSVHFNSTGEGNRSGPIGCEVLYVSSKGEEHADTTVDAICSASSLINRGPKYRDNLFFLNNTEMPAILVETCFVDSQADVNIYHDKFEEICSAIGSSLAGGTAPPPVEELTEEEQEIINIASDATIADYSWKDRGKAPVGYINGFALAWAQVVHMWMIGDSIAMEMAKADTRDDSTDALSWYRSNFTALGMDNSVAGIDTLRHLFVLLMGLGMRESSGKHCEGRDMSASNTSSDTCEAGLFQTSYDAHGCSKEFDNAMVDYEEGARKGYMSTFAIGVSCSSSSWSCYGSGKGYQFQEMCKKQPAFAVETCALVLRNRRKHYGPINEKAAELKVDADLMLHEIQNLVMDAAPPVTEPPPENLEARVQVLEQQMLALEKRVTALEDVV